MSSIGARLKEARELKQYTQKEIAKLLGISIGTLSGYERDYRDPDTLTLKKLAELYEVTLDYLVGLAPPENVAYFFGVKETLTKEEALHLQESLEMFRLLCEKRNKEQKDK